MTITRRSLVRAGLLGGVGLLVAACGGATGPAPAAATKPPAAAATTPAKSDAAQPTAAAPAGKQKATIALWTHDFQLNDFFKRRGAEWAPKQAAWDVTIDFQVVQDPPTKMLTSIAANQGVPELMLIESNSFTKFQKKDIATTALMDLTPLINDAGGTDNFVKLSIYMLKGKHYGVDVATGPVLYFYREDLFKEAGIQLPLATFEDVIREGVKMTAKGRYMESYLNDPFWLGIYNRYLEARIGGAFDAEGNVLLDKQEAIDTLQLMADLVQKHKVAYMADTDTSQTVSFKGDKSAGIIMADWWAAFVMGVSYKEQVGKWKAQAMPEIVKGAQKTAHWGGNGLSIYQKAPNRELVANFYSYALLQKENNAKFIFENGYWPTMKSAWKEPGVSDFKSKDLGDQNLGELLTKVSSNLVQATYGPFWGEQLEITGKAVQAVMTGKAKPDEALKGAAKNLRDVIAKG